MEFRCLIDENDCIYVNETEGEVSFEISEDGYATVVYLSPGDAMNLAAHIVRLVHGESFAEGG